MARPPHRRRHEVPRRRAIPDLLLPRPAPLFANDTVKDLFVERLAYARELHRFQIFAWVIMPEHVHLMLLPRLPDHPVSAILTSLKQPFAREVIARWRKLDAPVLNRLIHSRGETRFWLRGGGYVRNTRADGEFVEKVNYIHANPVRRGLVDNPTDWKWSSARWHAGMRDGELPMDPL